MRFTLAPQEVSDPRTPKQDRREGKAANDENTPAIAGVLYERGFAKYGLIDGYHRFKWLKEHKQESGLYIVLKNSGLSR